MECSSQNDVVHDFASVMKSGSELDINLDGVINKNGDDTKNEMDIFSNLITAIEESLSGLSVNTAVTEETIEQSLNAYADPSLNTRMSFSTASELSNGKQKRLEQIWNEPDYRNQSPLRVWRNGNKIAGFQMYSDEKKVTVVDSLECLLHLDMNPPIEPVYFDPRIYLGIPYSNEDFEEFSSIESVSETSTANLGPTSEEFEDWIKEIEGDE
ncbi:unnamed protein product [Caenorhabditis brenneri]